MRFLDHYDFTKKQRVVAEALFSENSMSVIAEKLGISYGGLQFHAGRIYAVCGVRTRPQFLVRCHEINSDKVSITHKSAGRVKEGVK